MKKKILRIGYVALSSLLFVYPTGVQSSLYFSGFYASVGGGAVWTKGEHKLHDSNSTRGVAKSTFSNLGFLGSFHAGYITDWKKSSTLILGGELYAIKSFNTMKKGIKLPDGAEQGRVKIDDNLAFGPALIVGKMINPRFFVYGKLAYEFGSISYKYRNLPFTNTTSSDRKIHHHTFTPGVGARYALSDHFHVGAEYSLVPIGKKTIQKDTDTIDGGSRRMESKTLNNRLLLTLTWQITGGK